MRALLVVVAILCGCKIPAHIPAFRTYRSAAAGFTVRYPRAWHADALAPAPGVVYATFAPHDGGPAIRVYSYPGHGPGTDNPVPDVDCRPIRIHGVRGKRCRALSTGAPVTVLTTPSRTYRISCDPAIAAKTYDRLVFSFRLMRRRK